MWSALGHASSDRRQQLTSHTKALELLEKDDRPERAEFLVEFAEWALAAGLPRKVPVPAFLPPSFLLS